MTKLPLAILLAASTALASSANPPDAKTGRPGEGSCLDCHSGPAGSADSTELTGVPGNSYHADSTYALTLTVRFAGQARWGFELTAVGPEGQRAGQLIVTDSAATQYSNTEPGYLKQTSAGTRRGTPNSSSWTFNWRAPATGQGPVTFYWCANAADNNSGSSGDAICQNEMRVSEMSGIEEQETEARRRFWHFSNPSRNRTIIDFHGRAGEAVRIYAASGRLVRTLLPTTNDDLLRVTWDGRDYQGRLVPEAGYFVRLGNGIDEVVKLQIAR